MQVSKNLNTESFPQIFTGPSSVFTPRPLRLCVKKVQPRPPHPMLTRSFRDIEHDYPGSLASILISGFTTKVKLTPNGLPDKKHWCHRCKAPF